MISTLLIWFWKISLTLNKWKYLYMYERAAWQPAKLSGMQQEETVPAILWESHQVSILPRAALVTSALHFKLLI